MNLSKKCGRASIDAKEQSQKLTDVNLAKNFSCAKCSYSSPNKSALISHMMSHKSPSETTMFRCDICGHKTKRKGDLRAHMIIHRETNELKMFQCANCPYESRRKGDLKVHMCVHNTHLHKCPLCPYQTTNLKALTASHSKMHKAVPDSFKCPECPYTSRFKRGLRIHSVTHKSPSELTMFQCNWCNFETKNKQSLRIHLKIVHTYIPEDEMFRCDLCEFKGKTKKDVRNHKRIHNKNRAYKCKECSYAATLITYLKRHMDSHKDISEVKHFICYDCGFRTKRKVSLKEHTFIHIRERIEKRKH